MITLGTVRPGSTIYVPFETFASSTGAPITLTGLAVGDILVYKDGSTTERASTSGFTLLDTDGIDFDGKTGIHGVSIDLSDNTTADFWQAGSRYFVVIGDVTVDSQTMRFVAATFRVGYDGAVHDTFIATLAGQTSFTLNAGPAEDDALNGMEVVIHDAASAVQWSRAVVLDYTGATKTVTLAAAPTFTIAAKDNISVVGPSPLMPTTAGRTLTIESDGMAHADVKEWLGVAPLALSSQQVQSVVPVTQKVDVETIKTRAVSAAGAVTVGGFVGQDTAAIGVNASGHVSRVVLTDTITTYTGNTPQTGDSFARIGANGTGLVATAMSHDKIDAGETFVDPQTDTAFDVDNPSRFKVGDVIQGVSELMLVTGVSGDTLTVTRAFAGTTAETLTAGMWLRIRRAGAVSADTDAVMARLGAPAGASMSADIAAVKTDTGNLVTRVGTPSNLGGGATVAANLADIEAQTDDIGVAGAGLTDLGGMSTTMKGQVQTEAEDALTARGVTAALFSGITSLAQWLGLMAGKQSGNATARTEIRATGAGSGGFDETTDSLEGVSDKLNLREPFPKGVALPDFDFAMYLTSGADAGTGLTVTGEIRKDSGSFAALSGTIANVAANVYRVNTISSTEMDAEKVTLKFTASGCNATIVEIFTTEGPS